MALISSHPDFRTLLPDPSPESYLTRPSMPSAGFDDDSFIEWLDCHEQSLTPADEDEMFRKWAERENDRQQLRLFSDVA